MPFWIPPGCGAAAGPPDAAAGPGADGGDPATGLVAPAGGGAGAAGAPAAGAALAALVAVAAGVAGLDDACCAKLHCGTNMVATSKTAIDGLPVRWRPDIMLMILLGTIGPAARSSYEGKHATPTIALTGFRQSLTGAPVVRNQSPRLHTGKAGMWPRTPAMKRRSSAPCHRFTRPTTSQMHGSNFKF